MNFNNRAGRANFIKNRFKKYIDESESILDVGCSDNELKILLGKHVFGIDISGKPDKIIDLEKEKISVFPNNSYEMVVCTEVLEHIDNLYEVLDDIKRVSSRYMLISLPNCPDIWKTIRILLTSRTGKFYGLPLEKPIDRHKWFFSWKELDIFFHHYSQKNNLKIKENFLHYNYGNSTKGKVLKIFLKILPIRFFAQSYWILLEKSEKSN